MNIAVIGLTGGIATGKTTAACCLRHWGFEVVDADVLAKQLFEERLREIQRLFPEIPALPEQSFRTRLSVEVFANPHARHKLNAFMHPAIRALMETRKRQLEAQNVAVVFYEAPLLFETGADAFSEASLVVYAPYALQLQRLMQRNAYSKEHAIQRIASQMDIETKRQRATWVVENLTTKEALCHKLKQWKEEVLSAFLSARK